jgi:hypothetical protein
MLFRTASTSAPLCAALLLLPSALGAQELAHPSLTDAPSAIHSLPTAPEEQAEAAAKLPQRPSGELPTSAPPSTPKPRAPESLRAAARRLKLPLPLPQGRVEVDKSARTLELWSGKTLVKRYRVALGPSPVGHKQKQGDGRTPEGRFFICTRNSRTSAFHIFLGLSYPGLPDASRGVAVGKISPREFAAIRSRLASRQAPLWRTRLGGWVGIHGGTNASFAAKIRQKRGHADWTQGCVALSDREIEEIHAATILGTPVDIRP